MHPGKTIQILRMTSDISLGKLAQECGVSVSLLSLIENGKRTPSLELLRKISKALRIPFSAMLLLNSNEDGLRTNNKHANDIVSMVDEMVQIESKLRKLLEVSD